MGSVGKRGRGVSDRLPRNSKSGHTVPMPSAGPSADAPSRPTELPGAWAFWIAWLGLAALASCVNSASSGAASVSARLVDEHQAAPANGAAGRFEPVLADLAPFVEHYRAEFAVERVTVAVRQIPIAGRPAASAAFGFGGPADAVLRAGSIGKWLTAVLALRLAARGQLDLDADVATLWPDAAPRSTAGAPLTLRHLLGHRGGVVRNSPVGSLYDQGHPTLAATAASLGRTTLLGTPGDQFVYSNAGYALVGALLERASERSFAELAKRDVFELVGMTQSCFGPRPEGSAAGRIWTYDGRPIGEPAGASGSLPALDLHTSADDLARFGTALLDGSLLGANGLAMLQGRGGEDGSGVGLGCFLRDTDDGPLLFHRGTVHGGSAVLQLLPREGLVVAVLANVGNAGAFVDAIATRTTTLALGRSVDATFPVALGRTRALALAGSYLCGDYRVELRERDGELFYDPDVGLRTRMRLCDDGSLVSDDLLSLGERRLWLRSEGRLWDGQEYYVPDDRVPDPCPAPLLPLLGEYGPDHQVLVVHEQGGRLAVLGNWVVHDLPEPAGVDHYTFPPGMFESEDLRFERDAGGSVVAAWLGAVRLERRPEPPPGGFRIAPRRPITELLAEAATDAPAKELTAGQRPADLVDLQDLGAGLRFDLRYATADNFVGAAVYPPTARAQLQRPAAEALARVQRRLAPRGLGLVVFDAYRPWSVTKVFWEATPEPLREFVADPAEGSRHNRGCAVDLGLVDLATGALVPMPSEFDEFTPRAYPDYPGGTSVQRYHRDLLLREMAAEGFTVNPGEWWHFDHKDWRLYGVGNAPVATEPARPPR